MNKFSIYNHFIPNGTHTLLYNLATDKVIALEQPLVELIQKNRTDIDRIETIHPMLFEALQQNGMVVNEELNEVEQVVNSWNETESDPSQFTITILPTLNCNLRCWYCYEEHRAGANMSGDIKDRIFRLIDNLTQKNGLQHLHLDFFGGEPLLGFKNVVLPIMEYARQQCTIRHIRLSLHITTNGVLLTDAVIQQIKGIRFDQTPTFQITLDGNREKHNATRHTCTGEPTFDLIVANIHRILKAGMIVNNRFNYTKENVDTLIELIDEYKDLTDEEKGRLHFDFQQVWQDQLKTTQDKAVSIMNRFQREKLCVNIYNKYNKERCYAEYRNKIVVNYNGDLYKCTARDFLKETREGVLNEDGTLTWNERFKKRMAIKNCNTTCRTCTVFPICHGRCSQAKLESPDAETCITGYSEKDKEKMIRERLHYLLTERKNA